MPPSGPWVAWTALSVLILLTSLVVVGLWLRRRRAFRSPRVKRAAQALRYPVVLAHGVLGFDALALPGLRSEYFRGIPARLKHLTPELHIVRVPPTSSISARAEALAKAVQL